jgi:3-vinyl bacteriochlorophyllide hydratase
MTRGQTSAGSSGSMRTAGRPRKPLYTPKERARRDASRWTLVQGILAPLQFLVFLVSLALVLRFLWTGEGYGAATVSVIVKTGFLYLIMVTGAIWEKVVFGQYLFAPAFFWEDVFSFAVIALHTAYLLALATHSLSPTALMLLALAAYATYVINAGQFLWKLRQARLQAAAEAATPPRAGSGSSAATPLPQGVSA